MAETLDTVLAKIQKLRRLSQSSNQNEAALAAEKAAELIAAYQIEEAQLEVEIDESREEVEHIDDSEVKRGTYYADILIVAVTKSLGCVAYRTGYGRSQRYAFIGRPSDVKAAIYLYGLIKGDIDRLAADSWKEAKAAGTWESRQRYTNGFKRGASVVVVGRLRTQRGVQIDRLRADATKSHALLVLNKRAEKIGEIERRLRLRGGRRASYHAHTDGYARGRAAGERVNIGGRAIGALGSAA